ncbi:MAG TPA: matrixin family metalloprotease, partial [Caulobacteraceae bacterium]
MRAWVRWLEVCVLAACLLLAAAGPASAHFDPAETHDYTFSERQLCYTLHADVAKDPNWVKWIDQAVAAWNAVAAQTGWSFRPCAEGEAADISINFAAGASAGGSFGGDGAQSQHEGQNLKSWHYDLKLNPDVSGMTLDGIKIEGGQQGWDTTGAKTLDPVQVVMHELTHAMRLSHSDSEGWNDGKTGSKFYYERPVAPGVHTGAVSADDITQTHAAAADGKPAANFHYPLPECFADEAARAKSRDDLERIMAQFQATIDQSGKDLVGQHDPDTKKGLYAQGRQAMSNLEAARETMKTLEGLKLCPGHALRNVGQNGQVAL